MPNITKCRECGSTSLTWDTHNKNISQAQQGRLTTQDIRCQFVLGCDHCSETLAVVSADQVAAWLTETREASAEPSAPVAWAKIVDGVQVGGDGVCLNRTGVGVFTLATADTLRSRLTEAYALLREAYDAGDHNTFGLDLDSRIKAALSDSEEPRYCGKVKVVLGFGDYHVCGEASPYSGDGGKKLQCNDCATPSAPVELTDEQIIEAMRESLNDADGGYVVDTAPQDVVKAGRALLARAALERNK